jgi:hypothetical protein
VAELADALGSGLSGHYARVGSSPTFGTGTLPASTLQGFYFPCAMDEAGVRWSYEKSWKRLETRWNDSRVRRVGAPGD